MTPNSGPEDRTGRPIGTMGGPSPCRMYCKAASFRSGDIKPDSVRPFSAPGEVYPQKWCTTLWVNEQNMTYDRGGSKRRALKRQPVAALCLAHCRTECRVFFMLLICRSPHYFYFCWPALMPERRGHAELHAQKRHRQVIHRCHTVKRRGQKFAQGISTCG